MISPINFKGVQIGRELSRSLPKKKSEKEPTGFYQVVNFLDSLDRSFDFRIKKTYSGAARIYTYNKEGQKIATTKYPIPVRQFAEDPAWVIGEIGMSIYSGDKIGRQVFVDMFEDSDKSADPAATLSARRCNDEYEERTRF